MKNCYDEKHDQPLNRLEILDRRMFIDRIYSIQDEFSLKLS